MHVKASKYKQKQVKTNNVCKQKQAKVSQSKQTQVKANNQIQGNMVQFEDNYDTIW